MTQDLQVNQFYSYKNNQYLIEYMAKMKTKNGEWVDAVIYTMANADRMYVRSRKDFESKFTKSVK